MCAALGTLGKGQEAKGTDGPEPDRANREPNRQQETRRDGCKEGKMKRLLNRSSKAVGRCAHRAGQNGSRVRWYG